jgi:FlaA1/EpsC-like NDP-sugar epimerase
MIRALKMQQGLSNIIVIWLRGSGNSLRRMEKEMVSPGEYNAALAKCAICHCAPLRPVRKVKDRETAQIKNVPKSWINDIRDIRKFAYSRFGKFERRNGMSNPSNGTALITGASSGIGAIYAERLARQGNDLILVARDQARLEAQADRLRKETGRMVEFLKADLGDADDVARVEAVLRNNSAISVLVNNAGKGATAPLLKSDIDAMVEMITLNVTALTRLTYAAVPGFVARGKGTIINISSIAAI